MDNILKYVAGLMLMASVACGVDTFIRVTDGVIVVENGVIQLGAGGGGARYENVPEWTNTIHIYDFNEGASVFTNWAFTAVGDIHNGAGGAAATVVSSNAGLTYVSFDGGDNITGTNDVGISGSENRSVSIWYNRAGEGSTEFSLAFGGTASLTVWGTSMDVAKETVALRVVGGFRQWTLDSSGLNEWHMLTLVMDGDSTADIDCYQDGVIQTQAGVNDQILNTTASHLHLGEDVDGDAQYTGFLDSVLIWDSVLTSNDVFTLYGLDRGMGQ